MRTPLLLAGLSLLPVLPGGEAFMHGVDWSATGVAAQGTSAARFDVAWNGFLGCTDPCAGTFIVTLSDAVSGAVLDHRVFSGTEGVQEFGRGYLGMNVFTGRASPGQGVAFSFTTAQVASTGGNLRLLNQAMTGSYQGWTFQAVSLLQPWDPA